MTFELFKESIEMTWEKAEPVIKDGRKQLKQPTWGEWFEYVHKEMKKRRQRQ